MAPTATFPPATHAGHRLVVSTAGLADVVAIAVREALTEGQRPVVVHPGAVIGAAIEVACEVQGIPRHDLTLIHTAAGADEIHRATAGTGAPEAHLVLACGDARCRSFDTAVGPRTCVVSMLDAPEASDVLQSLRDHDRLEIDGIRLDISHPSGELLAIALLADCWSGDAEELFMVAAADPTHADIVEHLRDRYTQNVSHARSVSALRDRLARAEQEHRAMQSRLDLAANIDNRLHHADGDLGQLLTLAATGCGRPVLLEDLSFRPLRWSSEPRSAPPSLSEIWTPRRATELARGLEPGQPQLVQLGRPRDGHRLVMRIGQQRAAGYLSICDISARDAELSIWLRALAAPVTVAMAYEVETTRVAANLRTQVVQMLLLGHLGPSEATAAARCIGWPAAGSRTVVAAVPREDDTGITRRTRDRHLHAAVREADRVGLPAAIIEGVLVFVAASSEDAAAVLRSADLHDAVALGVGTEVSDPADIARCYREAVWAARMAHGRRIGMVDFSDSGLHRLFLPGNEGGDPEFERPIVELEEAAEQCNFDPMETLVAFLDAGGNASRAAEVLHLHLNSVRYRLQRIGKICGADLTDPETRFRLQLAIRLRDTRQALREAMPEMLR